MVWVACLESLMLSGGMKKNPKLQSWVIYWGTRYLIEFDLDNICEWLQFDFRELWNEKWLEHYNACLVLDLMACLESLMLSGGMQKNP
jgi:hypothetical protein